MNCKKLYIIGNGFDLQHGMKSSYWDFKTYLESEDADLVEKLESYFGSEALWSDFEETLSNLNVEQIILECMDYLPSYDVEDWSDAYHHDYEYEVQKRIDLITETLKQRFTEWILQLKLPEIAEQSMVRVDNRAIFINFNYTDTLERLYKVPRANIFYVHNKAIDTNSTLILGHSRNPSSIYNIDKHSNDEDADIRVAEGNRILDAYFVETYKSTETIIQENKPFFDNLSSIEMIYVYGHSLSVVDKPYFVEILERIDRKKVIWKVSFYNKNDLLRFNKFFLHLNIPKEQVMYDRMYAIDSSQLAIFPREK